ncbi:MAG: hypothetical protein ABIQ66_07950 [Novosphingobium sp.]
MDTEAAWALWHATIEKTRAVMLARPEALAHSRVRDQALYTLQAMIRGGFDMYVAPRQDYPCVYRQSLWSPFETPWGGPAADMVYGWCFIDGTRTYRLTGRIGTNRFTDLHLFTGYFGDEDMRSIGNFELGRFTDADGRFDVIMSAQKHAGNWIELDPAATRSMFQLRDTWWDWENERGTQIHIECLDRPSDSMIHTEAELAARLVKAARLIESTTKRALHYARKTVEAAGGANAFASVLGSDGANRNFGASPRAGYLAMVWDLAPDEALVIEGTVPNAHYWSIQLMDLFWGTLDFSHHQSGLNGHQMALSPGGTYQAVIAFDDPGVPNWIDPIRTPTGQCLLRWYDGTGSPPRVTRMKAADLPFPRPISPRQRQVQLNTRAKASLARWGY